VTAVDAAPKLISLHVSPWSERARWALDHHGIAYQIVEHSPVLGERRLRRWVGTAKPRATVPVLMAGSEVLTESWDIAAYADRTGAGSKLIVPEHDAQIRQWVERADDAMQAGRALILAAIIASPAALDEAMPRVVPRVVRPLLRPVARNLTRALAAKYAIRLDATETHERVMRAALDAARAGLAGRPHLLGGFTYADIAVASMLQGISPAPDRFWRIGPGTRRAWTHRALASEYADLVSWRDALYEAHRPASAAHSRARLSPGADLQSAAQQ
jgi:glutathione S-transferase